MGWTDLFKSKSIKIKPDPRIRWFGKLPTYGDYYSAKGNEDWAVEFNDWVLKGYQIYHSRQRETEQGKHKLLPLAACTLRLPKSGMTVLASIQDFGGDQRGRPFPLCFYVGVPSALWPGPTSDTLAAAARVLADLAKLRNEVVRFINSPGHFDTRFADREVNLDGLDEDTRDESWQRVGKEIPLAEWFEAIKDGLSVPDAETWRRVSGVWGDNIAKYESKTFEPTLRFPLAMKWSTTAQIAGWLRWLEARMELKRRYLSLMTSGEATDATGRLSVVARDLVPDDFLLLTPIANSLTYVDDICRVNVAALLGEGGNGAETAPAARPAEHWLDFAAMPTGVA